MSIILSCSIGEAISKGALTGALGAFKAQDESTAWKKVFYVTIGLGLVCMLPTCLFVRDKKSYVDVDAELVLEKSDSEKSTPKDIEDSSSRKSLPFCKTTIKLLQNPRILLLGLLMMCISCLREVLGAQSVPYMKSYLHMDDVVNTGIAATFCAASAIGTFIGGRLIDSIPKRHRAFVNVFYMTFVGLCMLLVGLGTVPGVINFADNNQRNIFNVSFILIAEVCLALTLALYWGACILH